MSPCRKSSQLPTRLYHIYIGVVAGCQLEPEPICPIEMELRVFVLERSTIFICSPFISSISPLMRPVPEVFPPLISIPGMVLCVPLVALDHRPRLRSPSCGLHPPSGRAAALRPDYSADWSQAQQASSS